MWNFFKHAWFSRGLPSKGNSLLGEQGASLASGEGLAHKKINLIFRNLNSSGDAIPVVVPTFNNITYCKNMIAQLRDRGVKRIIIFDSGSTYKPMQKFLSSPPKGVEVIANLENHGPHYPIINSTFLGQLPNYFCLTDPDLEFNSEMPSDFLEDLAQITDRFKIGKAGLALDISGRDTMLQKKFKMATGDFTIWDWEAQFWKKPAGTTEAGDQIYKAPIDTTFAVYNKKYYRPKKYWEAVRVAGRYTCKHLTWYQDNGLPKAEEEHYRKLATRSYYLSDNAPIADATK